MSLYRRLDEHLEANADAAGPVRGTTTAPHMFMIWLAANLVVTTLLTGTLFVPGIDFAGSIGMIVAGTLLGAIVLTTIGAIGTRTGLSTMALTRGSFGTRGTLVPVAANILVLMGWSWVQAMLAGVTVDALVMQTTGYSNPILFSVLCEVIVVILAIFGHEGIAKVEPWLAVVMIAIIAWIFWQAFGTYSPAEMQAIPTDGSMTHGIVLDIVIATAISWTVLSADINRYARTTRGGVLGSGIGYAASTVISMSLGTTAIAYVALSGAEVIAFDPATIVTAFGPAFAIVVFVSVMATNTMAVYGMTTSFVNSLPGRRPRFLSSAIGLGIISIAGSSLLFLLDQFVTFLTLIGAMFVPVFAIMIVDYFVIRLRSYTHDLLLARGGRYWFTRGVNWIAIGSWAVGAGLSLVLTYVWPSPIGATIPAFVVTVALYLLAMLPRRDRERAQPSTHLLDVAEDGDRAGQATADEA